MRRFYPALLALILVWTVSRPATPRTLPVHMEQSIPAAHPDGFTPHPARGDTIWFGDDDGAAHPYEGGVWDFDPVAGDPMQGWLSRDLTTNRAVYFGHATEDSFLLHGDPCIPIAAGNAGMIWCGVHTDEALERDFIYGMGYQNKLCQKAHSPEYTIDPLGDALDLGFEYFNHTEEYYDYTYVYVLSYDGGGELLDELEIACFDAAHGDPWNLAIFGDTGPELPAGTLDPLTVSVRIEFRATSDGGWSDEDGYWDSPCGPFGADNVHIEVGSIGADFDFSDGPQGWTFERCAGIGDFVSIIDQPTWEPWVTEAGVLCQCGLGGNALGFVDLEGCPFYPPGMHDLQKQMAYSTPIARADMPSEDWNAVVVKLDIYMHMTNDVCAVYRPGYMYFPYTTAVNPEPHWSPRMGQDIWFYGANSLCENFVLNLSDLGYAGDPLPSDWDSVKFTYETFCEDYWPGVPPVCTELGETKGSPLLDNVQLGVYQDPDAPNITLADGAEFQDGFGQGFPSYLEPSDRGDANIAFDLSGGSVGVNRWLADSLAVTGPLVQGEETRWLCELRFHISRPGARQGLVTAYHAWKARLPGDPEAEFVAILMDSSEASYGPWAYRHKFCTFIHEDDPAFDPAYPDHSDQNEILPDGTFVPGTRIEYYAATWWYNYGAPPEEYFTTPVREFEILPGMTLVPGEEYAVQWPCVLYVDAYNLGGERYIEAMLSAAGVEYDKYDYLHAASNFNAPLKRSFGGTGFNPGGYGNNGCTLEQLLGYRLILVSTGNYTAPCMEPEDFALFGDWLANTECGGGDRRRGIIFDGDGVAGILADPAAGHAPAWANSVLGISFEDESYREFNEDEAYCVYLAPAASGAFEPLAPGLALFGSGCPRIFDYDVLGTQTGVPGVTGNLRYFSYGGTGQQSYVDYAQVVREHTEPGVANWRSVVDGFSLHHLTLQQPDCPNDSASIVSAGLALLTPQLEWMNDPEEPFVPWRYLCGGAGAEPEAEMHLAGPINHLYCARPNPFANRATLRFSLGQPTRVELAIYDPTGRRVRTLLDAALGAGEHDVTWEGLNDHAQRCAAGIYWVQMRTASGYTSSRRMLRLE